MEASWSLLGSSLPSRGPGFLGTQAQAESCESTSPRRKVLFCGQAGTGPAPLGASQGFEDSLLSNSYFYLTVIKEHLTVWQLKKKKDKFLFFPLYSLFKGI